MAIEPSKITNFDRTDGELVEFALFCMCVAGKNSDIQARKLQALIGERCALEWLTLATKTGCIRKELERVKMGQYTRLTRSFEELSFRLEIFGIDFLRSACLANIVDLMGNKTGRFFVLHSRPDVRCAVLDTHILRYLWQRGYKAPAVTPQSRKKYSVWENIFLDQIEQDYPGQPVAEVDLILWNRLRASLA